MSKRLEFSKKTKLDAFRRSGGECEKCTAKLAAGGFEYHHILESTMGGDNGLGNCQVLCRGCHGLITGSRAKDIAKSNRQRAKHLGFQRKTARPLPFGKTSRLKKKIDGTIVERD